mmetsp:Transcript_50271/g.58068  ORF Transcript_50271/g.58068 Transcript_50271/m.58068 type:complete len:425 (-) Transcript_50271:225-1499(-)
MKKDSEQQRQTSGPIPIRVALLGTGIFAANCTFPTVRKLPDKFELVAVWSRRKESVEGFLEKHNINNKIDSSSSENTHTDNVNDDVPGFSGDEGLDQILHNSALAVDALVMALPISAQPVFIELALQAGKHVLSEKPIAATLEEAKRLLHVYEGIKQKRLQQQESTLQWSVAENFRYEPAIEHVARVVANGEIGKPTLFSLLIRLPFKPGNKYLHTDWRSKPKWYGGLIPDVFVHSTALLRKVFARTNHEPKQVSAVTTSTADHIPSVDTMSSIISFVNTNNNGDDNSHLHGTVSLSFACTYVKYELEVNGVKGAVLLQRKTKVGDSGYIVTVLDENGQERSKEEFQYGGIEREFVAFANACHARCYDGVGGKESVSNKREHDESDDFVEDWNTPLEAMRDLELVEACLKSGIDNGKPIVLPLS